MACKGEGSWEHKVLTVLEVRRESEKEDGPLKVSVLRQVQPVFTVPRVSKPVPWQVSAVGPP